MFDAVSRSEPAAALQRATGSLRLRFKRRGDATVLDTLYQQGCLKARLPATEAGGWRGAVTLNSAGGVAGGDRLDTTVVLRDGCQASVSAQAAERFYRVVPGGGPAVLRNRVVLGAAAALEWLPQETILFDRCALDRRLEVEMAADARFLGVEMLVFGRLAMGEVVRTGVLRDLIRVRRDGALVWHDAIRIDGAVEAVLCRPAVAAGARAVATIVYVAPDAEDRLDAVRAAGDRDRGSETVRAPPSRAGAGGIAASAWNGMVITRVLAATGSAMRACVLRVLGALRDGRPLPRVWLC